MDKTEKFFIANIVLAIPLSMVSATMIGLFIAPVISDISINPEIVGEDLSLSVVDVTHTIDHFTITLVGPDGNVKDIRTNG